MPGKSVYQLITQIKDPNIRSTVWDFYSENHKYIDLSIFGETSWRKVVKILAKYMRSSESATGEHSKIEKYFDEWVLGAFPDKGEHNHLVGMVDVSGNKLTIEALEKWEKSGGNKLVCSYCNFSGRKKDFAKNVSGGLVCPQCNEYKGIVPKVKDWDTWK